MHRMKYHIFAVAVVALSVISCLDRVETEAVPQEDMDAINAACIFDTRVPKGATRAIIDQLTTRQMDANFLRIDEEKDGEYHGLNTFEVTERFHEGGYATSVNWERAYLCEAKVISSPDNTEDSHYRSIIFSPKQTYGVNPGPPDIVDYYHTRMVGWYPKNCELPIDNANKRFDESYLSQTDIFEDPDSHRYFKAVKFTGLDGATDVMVSNVCEGQYWHSATALHASEYGNLPYRVPFGHYQEYDSGSFTTRYNNFFKFRHYLSGIRIWAFVPEQNSHALDMWGNITDVVLLNQPTSVCVTLPEEPRYDINGNSLSWAEESANYDNPLYWGRAYGWSDYRNLSVQTGPMFGDDSNHSSENYTVDFSNMSMEGIGDVNHARYMGYSLVQPDAPVQVEIHTRYGVYVTTIDTDYQGHELFKAGYYYDVYLSLQTDGTISAIIETRGNDKYYDLTRNVPVTVDGNVLSGVVAYQYANSYVIDPATFDNDSDGVCDYDGFFFSGTVAGNGDGGVLDKTFYPSTATLGGTMTARLIWESSRSLVTNIELINGYVKFKIPGIKASGNYKAGKYVGTKGNAVIGVFDGNDKCLWSWHIWITDKPADLAYTTGGGNTLYLMDRNLGATFGGVPNNAANSLASYGLYYQWGRKDPSVGPKEYKYTQQDGQTAEYYDYASDPVNSALPKFFEYPSLRDGVENPMFLILPTKRSDLSYTLDWLYYTPANVLWGYNHRSGSTTKSIYDPCPYGYRVPTGEVAAVMENATYSKTTYGVTFTVDDGGKLFFPFAGYKGVDKSLNTLTTSWKYVGEKGDYQEGRYNPVSSAGENTQYYRKRLLISNSTSWTEERVFGNKDYKYGAGKNTEPVNVNNVFSDWANRRTAASVRCVKDVEFGAIAINIAPASLTFSADDAVDIVFDVSSAGNALTNVTVTMSYNDGSTQSTELYNLNPKSAMWHQLYTFNAKLRDAAFYERTDRKFEFKVVATNAFGISKTNSVTLIYQLLSK